VGRERREGGNGRATNLRKGKDCGKKALFRIPKQRKTKKREPHRKENRIFNNLYRRKE